MRRIRWTLPGLLIATAALFGCSREAPPLYQGYAEGEYVRVAAPYAGSLTSLTVQRGTQVGVGAPVRAGAGQRKSGA